MFDSKSVSISGSELVSSSVFINFGVFIFLALYLHSSNLDAFVCLEISASMLT